MKLNYINLQGDQKFIYTIGLVLKILNIYKKSSRRISVMIKNVILFCIKKHNIYTKHNFLIIKGFYKKILKILYMFKNISQYTSLFYIQPLKSYKLINIKRKRSIKRRIYKKLISFSNN